MTSQQPIYTRLFMVPEVFGISEDTVRRWERRGLLKIHKRGRMSFVRNEDVAGIIENGGGADCGSTSRNQA